MNRTTIPLPVLFGVYLRALTRRPHTLEVATHLRAEGTIRSLVKEPERFTWLAHCIELRDRLAQVLLTQLNISEVIAFGVDFSIWPYLWSQEPGRSYVGFDLEAIVTRQNEIFQTRGFTSVNLTLRAFTNLSELVFPQARVPGIMQVTPPCLYAPRERDALARRILAHLRQTGGGYWFILDTVSRGMIAHLVTFQPELEELIHSIFGVENLDIRGVFHTESLEEHYFVSMGFVVTRILVRNLVDLDSEPFCQIPPKILEYLRQNLNVFILSV